MIGHNRQPAKMSFTSLNPEEKKRVKHLLDDLSDSLTRVAAEKEYQKEAIDTIVEELGLDKALLKKILKVYYEANYKEHKERFDDFTEAYETVTKE